MNEKKCLTAGSVGGAAWLIAGVLLLAPTLPAVAAESVLPITPPGSTDTDQALLPPKPGFYMGLFSLPYSADTRTYALNGKVEPDQFSVHDRAEIAGPAFLYVYPGHLLGGTWASSFVQPFERQSAGFGNMGRVVNEGTGDAYSDLLSYSRHVGLLGANPGHLPMPYGLTFDFAYSMIIPDGQYDHNHFFKLGSHSWVPDPNIALTYNTGRILPIGDNTQFSTRLYYAIPTRDTTNGYVSGNIVDLDFAVTEQFGRFRIGAAGYFQGQVTPDRAPGGIHFPDGNRFSEVAAGPIMEYFLKNGMFIKAKYTTTFVHNNYVDQSLLLISTGFKL